MAMNRFTSKKRVKLNTISRPPKRGSSGGEGSWLSMAGSMLRWALGLALGSAVLLGLFIGALHLYRYVTTHEYFAIREISIKGIAYFNREAILEASGLKEGLNSFAVNIADIEKAIRKSPVVAEVSVKRHLPDRFEIIIKERIPSFWVKEDGLLLYADDKGNLIAPVDAGNFLSLPTLELEQGGEALLQHLPRFISLLKAAELPVEWSSVSWLRLSAAKGFELYLESNQLTMSVGMDDWEKNLHNMTLVLSDLANRNEIKNSKEIWAIEGSVWVAAHSVIP